MPKSNVKIQLYDALLGDNFDDFASDTENLGDHNIKNELLFKNTIAVPLRTNLATALIDKSYAWSGTNTAICLYAYNQTQAVGDNHGGVWTQDVNTANPGRSVIMLTAATTSENLITRGKTNPTLSGSTATYIGYANGIDMTIAAGILGTLISFDSSGGGGDGAASMGADVAYTSFSPNVPLTWDTTMKVTWTFTFTG